MIIYKLLNLRLIRQFYNRFVYWIIAEDVGHLGIRFFGINHWYYKFDTPTVDRDAEADCRWRRVHDREFGISIQPEGWGEISEKELKEVLDQTDTTYRIRGYDTGESFDAYLKAHLNPNVCHTSVPEVSEDKVVVSENCYKNRLAQSEDIFDIKEIMN